jgi:hypothetical protein
MSGTHLPDNLSDWPDDPRSVLGVQRKASARDVRSAYAKLIRVFKPEQFPEQFRRVRDAYEFLTQYGDWFDSDELEMAAGATSSGHAGDASPEDRGETKGDETAGEIRPREPDGQAPPLRSQSPPDPVDAAWTLARDGQLALAYQRLTSIAWSAPGNEDVCLRLYWLLRLAPHLDGECDRRDWLVEALRASRLEGRAMEMYRRELQREPVDILQPRWSRLLEVEAAPSRFGEMLVRRWDAFEHLGHCELIRLDLPPLRAKFAGVDRLLWTRILLAAIDHLAWERDRATKSAVDLLVEEIHAHYETHSTLEAEMDRCDLLVKLASHWQAASQAKGFPPGFMSSLCPLVRQGWNQPFGVVRLPLQAFLASLVENPLGGLELLDRLKNVSPPMLDQLAWLVAMFDHERFNSEREPATEEKLMENLKEHLREQDWSHYDRLRNGLLFVCIQRSLSLSDIARAAELAFTPYQLKTTGLENRLRTDTPMRIMCDAARAFWS